MEKLMMLILKKCRLKALPANMKINVLRKMDYKKDFRIFIVQFDYTFQYLITDKQKNLYQDNMTAPPNLLNRIKFALHLIPTPYSKQEMEVMEEMLLGGAVRSIDKMLSFEDDAKKEIEEVNRVAKAHGDTECTWRSVTVLDEENNEKVAWQCILHSDIVPMIDGQKPTHS